MANDKIPHSAQETVSAENRRFTELVESGKYGKILKDPATGDVAVIFDDKNVAKLKANETFTSTPEYGAEKNPAIAGAYLGTDGSTFSPRFESRPMTNAEILAAAKAKIESANGGESLKAVVPKMLSEFGVALEENGKTFRLTNSGGGEVLEFEIDGKTKLERQTKAAQLHLVVGKAVEIMRSCEARHPLMAECKAYSSADPIVSYGYRELKIDDALFGDSVVASGEELAGLTKGQMRAFAEKLAPFINSVFKARYGEIVKKNTGPLASNR